MRDAYIAAEVAVLKGQAVEFGGRKLTLANLPEIRKGRQEWEQRASAEAAAAAGQSGPLSTYGANFPGCYSDRTCEDGDGWSRLG